jgi:ATP synthase protein I
MKPRRRPGQVLGTIPWVLGVVLVCSVVAGVAEGRDGVLAALVGGAVVCAFFVSSPLALGPVTKVSPHLSLLVAMVFFVTKVVALVAVFTVLLDRGGLGAQLDRKSFGLTVIVTAVGWTFLQIRAARRQRVPLYDLGDTGH